MAAATKTTKTTRKPAAKKAPAKRKGTAAAALAKPLGELTAAEKKKVVTEANKNPRALTRDQRAELHAAGLAAQGLKGKAAKLWIEKGETPAETVKRNPGKPAGGKGTTGKGKALTGQPRPGSVNGHIADALAKGPQTIEQLATALSKARGKATTRGTVVSAVKWGEARKWWTRKDETVTLAK